LLLLPYLPTLLLLLLLLPPLPLLPRSVVGYCAHWRESLADPDTKILRPQQDYRGVWLRRYVPLEQRPEGGHAVASPPGTAGPGDAPLVKAPGNAYRRRVAGEGWM
jgi:citrate synthase